MAAGPGIDAARFLHEHPAQAFPDLLHVVLSTFVDALRSAAEADAGCGASYGVVSEQRVNSRNGHRHRVDV